VSRAEDTRFGSWKEIASYLDRDLRTVRRWEKERELPVHRVPGGGRACVYAYASEIDAWLKTSGRSGNGNSGLSPQPQQFDAQIGEPSWTRPTATPTISPAARPPTLRRVRRILSVIAAAVSCVLLAFLVARVFLAHNKAKNPVGVVWPTPGVTDSGGKGPRPPESMSRASVVQAVVRKDQSSLQLPSGERAYLYALATDGVDPATPFVNGQYASAIDRAGQLSAALAYGPASKNGFGTHTKTHVIGGVSISGSWQSFDAFSGSNQEWAAHFAAVSFTLPSDSLVVIIGVASGQQYISIEGLPAFSTDAWSSGDGTEAMIIGHVYLPAGAYMVTESSSASLGQPNQDMVDLLGAFVFGSAQARADETASARRPDGNPSVTKENQCLGGGSRSISDPASLGTLQIQSGAGAFADLTSKNKTLRADAGSLLDGTVTLRAIDLGPAFASTPLIQTPSWGDPQSTWRLISNVSPGQQTLTAQIRERLPSQAGVYHILFAFNMEMDGGNVASLTNWARGRDVWNDGNDLAQMDSSEIQDAQQSGCIVTAALGVEGYVPIYLPADAITVNVISPQTGR
jgi:hypothetical protein